MASFWSNWVIILTVITFIGMTWILFANRTRTGNTDDATTGHEYDGIQEFDNPLPAWWFYMFVLTIVWGVGYLIVYPGMGNFPGLLGWTQIQQHENEVSAAEEKYRSMRDRYMALPVEEISADPAVRKMGMRIFSNNCAQCHGADAKGSYGFPNLADADWVFGGTPEQIKASITNGRKAAMPAWGDILGEEGVANVTSFVLSLNGREAMPEKISAGKEQFAMYCAACHGAEGQGNTMMGSPNLANGIWLYGGTAEQIGHSVRAGRNGEMPAHDSLISEDKIHILTAYVYGLSR